MSLEEAIQQLINLGEKDPLTIARKIQERHDDRWLLAELQAHAEDLLAQFARSALGAQRRSSEIALRPGDQVASAELKLRTYWIPEVGYKKGHELTPEDLRTKAIYYDRIAVAAERRAAWCRDVADMMDAEGAKTLGKLKQSLPPLPEERELAPA